MGLHYGCYERQYLSYQDDGYYALRHALSAILHRYDDEDHVGLSNAPQSVIELEFMMDVRTSYHYVGQDH